MNNLNYLSNKFRHAFNGLKISFTTDKSIFIHLIITLCVLMLGYVLKLSQIEWLFILSAVFLVIFAEIMNSAIELLCDFIELKQNKKIAIIKDLMAGAVLFMSFYAGIIAFIIFYPKLKQLLEVKI